MDSYWDMTLTELYEAFYRVSMIKRDMHPDYMSEDIDLIISYIKEKERYIKIKKLKGA